MSGSGGAAVNSGVVARGGDTIVVRVEASGSGRRWLLRVGGCVLLISVALNVWLIARQRAADSESAIPVAHLFGDEGHANRILVLNISGTISPPFTERWLAQLKAAQEDESILGVVLAIDSPGGLVADSHQLYREIRKLAERKPVNVAMKRLAASGGYYISMGIGPEGRIFAEPTTWTGSIGVIVPRYNASELAGKLGVRVEPLVTGPLKDTLNPFRDFTDQERVVWDEILKDAFDRFVGVISENRTELDDSAVRVLATGQIYTSQQAVDNHLVDAIGYVEDAVAEAASRAGITEYDVIEYRMSAGLIDVLLGGSTELPRPDVTTQWLDAATPRVMYYCSWNPWVPVR